MFAKSNCLGKVHCSIYEGLVYTDAAHHPPKRPRKHCFFAREFSMSHVRRLSLFVAFVFLLQMTCFPTAHAAPICSVLSFRPATNYTVQGSPRETQAADFNHDGRLDLAVVRITGGIVVMINDGSGSFGPPTYYSTNSSASDEVEIADFNGDSHLDLAVTNYFANTVSLLFGTGTGTFSAAENIPSGGPRPQFLIAADFNRDGKIDLGVANVPVESNGNFAILQGDGAGGFTLTNTLPQPGFTRAADFNNDGNLDLLTQTTELAIYLGNGQGSFSGPTTISVGVATLTFTIGDYNRDNKQDVAVLTGSSPLNIRVLFGNGNGTFGPPNFILVQVSLYAFITTGDFNVDGNPDLAVTNGNPSSGAVLVLLGTGAGGFSPPTIYAVNAATPTYIAAADLNSDGREDMLSSNLDSIRISVLTNTCLNPTPRYDFDGDGRSDIAVYRPSSGIWYAQRSTDSSLLSLPWGLGTDRIVPGDYDGDSKTDVAVYRPSIGAWFVLRSTNSTFIAQSWGISTDQPVPADYDADGRTDLAVYRSGVWYVLKSSDGSVISNFFGLASDKPMPADYDGDGRADIAVYRPSEGMWYIQQSSDNGFRAKPFGADGDVPVTGDFDGDGKADAAVYRPSTGTWYALASINNSVRSQNWGVATDTPVPADYDGDGKTDHAVYRPIDGVWYILKSTDSSFTAQPFGLASDLPIEAGY